MRVASSLAKLPILPLVLAASVVAYPGPARGDAPPAPTVDGYVDTGGGVQLRYRRVGDAGDPVVVLHGGPGLTMEYLAADLSPLAAGRSLVFYDQRGAGGSTLVTDAAALDAARFVDDLEAVRRHFALERMALVGHSWGAGVAALYAMRHPERVSRMVLVGPMPLRRSELDRSFAAIAASRSPEDAAQLRTVRDAVRADPGDADACRKFYAAWFRPFFADPAAMARVRGDFCAGTPEALRNGALVVGRHTVPSLGDFDWRDSLGRVAAPVLVLVGTREVIPIGAAVEWNAAFPDARLLLMDGVGHFPYVEAPDAFFPVVDAFLRGQWPAAALISAR
jgi:proline iminopeptidase